MRRPRLRQLALAAAAPTIAIVIRLALDPLVEQDSFTFTPLFAAVVLVGWYSGLRIAPASLCAVPAPVRMESQSQETLVAVTGWGQSEDRRRTKESGFGGHLVKPITADALVDVLKSARGPAETAS
jgi:hypothetical protein